MGTTPDERKPDREGYLGFKDAIDNGNEALNQRAGALWWAEKPPKTELAQYYDLYLTQGFIDKHFNPSEYRHIAADASKHMSEIRNPVLRERIAKRVERLDEAWYSAKTTALLSYSELNSGDLKAEIAARQVSNPHETESQSWFNIKRDIDTEHLDHLDYLQKKFEHAVDKQIGRALASEAKSQAATTLDHARAAYARYKERRHDHDRDIDHER